MTMTPDDDFKEQLALLQQKYSLRICEILPKLQNFRSLLREDSLDPEELDDLRHCAHNLAGSGSSYGFPQITATGRAVENLIAEEDGPLDMTLLSENLDALIEACVEAAEKNA